MKPGKASGTSGWFSSCTTSAILAACIAAGCASSLTSDGFSGEFEEVPTKGFFITDIKRLTISDAGQGHWNAKTVGTESDEVSSQTWREMSREDVRHLFTDGAPFESIRCIHQGWPMPMLCRVPTKVALSFRQNDSSWSSTVSDTGYLIVFGSPAGIHSPVFRKVK